MDMIWMQHPLLPEDQLIYEPAEARIGHETAGWRETDPPMLLEEPMMLDEEESDNDSEAAVESRHDNLLEDSDGEEK